MKNCALLTMDNLRGFYCYDELLIEPLEKYGWNARLVSWRDKNIDWNLFDIVIIRSTWDYQKNLDHFFNVLNEIERSSATLYNSLNIVKWNISKFYLTDLEEKGVPCVPTLWRNAFDIEDVLSCFDHFSNAELILKPVVSANADLTFRLTAETLKSNEKELARSFHNCDFMIQPFLHDIIREGEYSLIFFCDEFSHCLLKTPQDGDYRVQEEHGGILQSIKKPEEELINTAQKAMLAVIEPCLYGRADLVRIGNQFVLMELELIEPSLYFNLDANAAERFAKVFAEFVSE